MCSWGRRSALPKDAMAHSALCGPEAGENGSQLSMAPQGLMPPSCVLALDEEILAVLSPPPSPCCPGGPCQPRVPCCHPHRSTFPCSLTLVLTICSHSLVPTSWWRSSSSTASQLSRPHLYREGHKGGIGGSHSKFPPPRTDARRWAAHSLMKCCVSSRLRKTRGPCVTVLTRFSSCWQSFGAMPSALGKVQQLGQVRYLGLR